MNTKGNYQNRFINMKYRNKKKRQEILIGKGYKTNKGFLIHIYVTRDLNGNFQLANYYTKNSHITVFMYNSHKKRLPIYEYPFKNNKDVSAY